jgi:hypothetical protein
MTDLITEEQFIASLPKGLNRGVPKQVLDDINDMISKGEEGAVFKENLMSHNHILKEGKFSLEQYVNAVKYISFRLMNHSQRKAYELTFPDKVTDWLANGTDEKAISSYVHAYNNSKLVMRLYDVTLVPFHLLNQPYRQEALLVEVELMRHAHSEMVRHKAAETVLNTLAPPETTQTELQMKVRESEETSELKNALADLAKAQKEMLERGGSLKDVAESTIVNAEYKEVE